MFLFTGGVRMPIQPDEQKPHAKVPGKRPRHPSEEMDHPDDEGAIAAARAARNARADWDTPPARRPPHLEDFR